MDAGQDNYDLEIRWKFRRTQFILTYRYYFSCDVQAVWNTVHPEKNQILHNEDDYWRRLAFENIEIGKMSNH